MSNNYTEPVNMSEFLKAVMKHKHNYKKALFGFSR